MRPRNLEEYVGQDHIVGVGRLLRRAIDADQLSSLIFYGPPGTGKTTLARVIAGSTQSRFVTLNAVLTGVADIRREISDAKDARDLHSKRTILFVDEVHRWNKSQQDALLPWVENGTVILIGATTENPYFEVNKALVSRSRVFQLTALQDEHLAQVARLALADQERGYGNWTVEFEEGALEHLVKVSSGDARSLLNALQLAVETSPERFPPPKGSRITVSLAAAEESIQKKAVLYDKEGDYHFDTISAFIKSLRGSDPDAALYWMALMIRAGEDPRFIFRRMLISACEDVGLAAPEALGVVESCAAAFDRVGLPEGQFHLTHAALYLATCPKSNSALGFFDALKAVDEERNKDVPNHLRDDSRDKHSFGHGEGYKYPHAWRDHWTAQQYLPDGLAGRVFYRPGHLGHEGVVRDTVISRREAQVAAMLETDESQPGEVLTYSPGDDERERWVRRTESRQETLALAIRHALYQHWSPQRHHRILILADPAGALVWEAHRRVPEGGVTALCPNTKAYDALSWLAGGLPVSERPRFQRGVLPDSSLVKELTEQDQRYDHIIARNWLANMGDENTKNQALHTLRHLAAEEAVILLAEPRPEAGTTLSQLIPAHLIAAPHFKKFQAAERIVHASLTPQKGQDQIIQQFSEAGWNVVMEPMSAKEQRILSPPLLEAWFSTDRMGSYGQRMSQELGQDLWQELSKTLLSVLTGQKVTWETAFWRINGVRTS
ncbi:MAG: AAA family ATPase [Spirochaetales bacterium]|nr:AAA family ATPase [Spirochaetales bacterium]